MFECNNNDLNTKNSVKSNLSIFQSILKKSEEHKLILKAGAKDFLEDDSWKDELLSPKYCL